MTTSLLGFETLHYNVVAAQMSRGKTERAASMAIGAIASTLGHLAMDVCMWMCQNFGFVSFPDEFTTGSSIMPHKKNPITAEKIAGLSRIVKANCQVAFDNVALWHERDISHSSAERVIFADSCIALDHMLQSLIRIVGGLVLFPKHMQKNLDATRGLIYSSKVLLALTDAGLSREEAYAVVQDAAMKTWDAIVEVKPEDAPGARFTSNLLADKRNPLSEKELLAVMDAKKFLHNTKKIYKRLDKLSFS